MSPAGITTGVTYDLQGLPTWTLLDGSTVSRDAEGRLTISRPGREDIRGRQRATETTRAAYDRLLELDGLQRAAAVLYDDYSAAVTVEADVAGQSVTVRVQARLVDGRPEVAYAVRAEVCGAGEGALCVGDVLPGADVSEEMIVMVETALVEAWPELEAA